MELESNVPPGFRFHPTEEELVGYYLQRKINSLKIDLDVIIDIDLYKIEPWDIQARCKLGYDEQNEWYFFNHKDKKYPTGTRTNRATISGFWKATGRDKSVLSKNRIIGMRKTLVFYKGRAPNGCKTDWIMHEYRLQSSEIAPPHEEGWVVCKAFKKPTPNHRQAGYEAWNNYQPPNYYTTIDYNTLIRPPPPSSSSNLVSESNQPSNDFQQHYYFGSSMQDPLSNHVIFSDIQSTDQLPQLDSPNSNISTNNITIESTSFQQNSISSIIVGDFDDELRSNNNSQYNIDWKNLDNLLVPHITDTTSFMNPTSTLPQNYDQDTRTNILGCTFPDL